MWILSAVVVIFGVLTVLNLILTLGVLKRLREQSELLTSSGGNQVADPLLRAGEVPDDFTGTTVDGEPVSRDDVSGARLVAFLSPACSICEGQIPGLLDTARSMVGGRDNVLVVVVGKGEETAAYAEQFRNVAKVVVEPGNGPITRAFQLSGLPAFGLLDLDARVVTSATSIDRLDVPVAS
jgi:hypothetical protein